MRPTTTESIGIIEFERMTLYPFDEAYATVVENNVTVNTGPIIRVMILPLMRKTSGNHEYGRKCLRLSIGAFSVTGQDSRQPLQRSLIFIIFLL